MAQATPRRPSQTGTPHSTPLSASTLKTIMKEELRDCLYQSDHLFDTMYPMPPDMELEKIIVLASTHINKLDKFPRTKSEPHFYLPLQERLNAVKDALTKLDLMEKSIYKDIKFEQWYIPMAAGIDGDEPLKLDLIARDTSKRDTASAHWAEIAFCAEVKDNWTDLIRSRRSVVVLFLNCATLELRFGLYTSAWLCVSKTPLNLTKKDDIEVFIKQMARIYMSTDRLSAGFDTSCNNRSIHIPTLGLYNYQQNLCYRSSVRGRRTRVDIIVFAGDDKQDSADKLHSYPLQTLAKSTKYTGSSISDKSGSRKVQESVEGSQPRGFARLQKIKTDWEAKLKLIPGDSKVPEPANLSIAAGFHTPRKKPSRVLIIKESWPIKGRDTEAEIFASVANSFGVPSVFIGPYKHQAEVTTDLFVPGKLESCDWCGGWPKAAEKAEIRVQSRVLISTQGKPLTSAKGHWVLSKPDGYIEMPALAMSC
ncbi:hypothetical protein M422DRAFT_32786 [Sphaerobolus stellatus SS14]|uniref:Unplaced genomic scaffold SPHSTscaffold_78, whole genome shotgun sequence n=1 Tax=Sphaerobolus stellatus (strain SS14) TaxID=990650 RepID=A0A0C9VMY7_SPHS4|nr:hypothetical protein M422DRAFT_32786 [Sphaerobolus stellatus SS14]